jgi:hypothetical protein
MHKNMQFNLGMQKESGEVCKIKPRLTGVEVLKGEVTNNMKAFAHLNFSSSEILSRKEMKKISGGDCYARCDYPGGGTETEGGPNHTLAEVRGNATACAEGGGRGRYCCASCSTASWLHQA